LPIDLQGLPHPAILQILISFIIAFWENKFVYEHGEYTRPPTYIELVAGNLF
jgi:hypothetical protein